ncbi:MAG: HlyD family efflux transporter periplasmic adaptor subunit [Bacteroidales bacterium]|nr:HlyD family efflux transporter periplasmic adaptor subunit [Bacteroidales bacterium]
MRKIDRRIVIISALIFIIGLSFGLMKFLIAQREDPKMQKKPDVKRFVKVDTIKYETLISSVEAPGRLSSLARTELIAEASGKIIAGSTTLKKGSTFKKGDLLFTIYPDEARLSLYSRKSQFKSTLANILPDLAFDYPEYEKLLLDYFNKLDIKKDFPVFPKIADSKLEIFLASRNLISEYYNIKKDELQLKRHNIYAPYNGTYKEVYLEESAYVNTGGRVATAIRTDMLEVETPLDRPDALWVKPGDKVTVYSDLSKRESTGKVIRKSAFIDENTQSQAVFINVSNKTGQSFLDGEFVHVVFPGHPVDNVMEIPRNAVFNNNEVFVIVEGRLQKRTINIRKVNEKTLLFNGVKEGEILVIQTLINVLEGTSVVAIGSSTDTQEKKPGEGSGQGNKKKDKS